MGRFNQPRNLFPAIPARKLARLAIDRWRLAEGCAPGARAPGGGADALPLALVVLASPVAALAENVAITGGTATPLEIVLPTRGFASAFAELNRQVLQGARGKLEFETPPAF